MNRLIALIALALLSISSTALAGGDRGACREDAERLCADAEGRKARKACLIENADALSEGCAQHIEHKQARRAERKAAFDAACGADAAQLCGDAEGRDLRHCMRDNRDQLSQTCADFVEEHRGRKHGKRGKRGKRGKHHRKFKAACGDDLQTYCGDVEGEGRERFEATLACMTQNEASLTAECRAEVEEVRAHIEKRELARAEITAACQADVDQLCAGAEGRDAKRCLRDNRDQLSQTCTDALEAHRPRHHRRGR